MKKFNLIIKEMYGDGINNVFLQLMNDSNRTEKKLIERDQAKIEELNLFVELEHIKPMPVIRNLESARVLQYILSAMIDD